jgi:phasin family protein
MSQKPRTGAPARVAAGKFAVKDAAGANPESVTEPAAEAVPAVASPVEATPAIVDPLEAAAEMPAADVPAAEAPTAEATQTEAPSSPANEAVSVAAELAAKSADAVATTIAATVDAVTPEVAETVSAIEPTNPTITQGIKSMMKTTEDFVAFGQANLEAFVKSGQIWSAGVQELTKQIATSAKASFDESVSTFKAMSTARSVKEAIDLQSSFAKAALEKAMTESNKLTDASIKLTEQTLAPITARVTVAVESFGKTA